MADLADFKAEWNLLIVPLILAEILAYNSLSKSEKLLGYCHFLLEANQFFLWNQIMPRYPVIYRVNTWTARLNTVVFFKLLYNSSIFYWFLLVSIECSWKKNRERHKILLDMFVSQGFYFLQNLNEKLLLNHHHSLQASESRIFFWLRG